jgi:hypothetical protein
MKSNVKISLRTKKISYLKNSNSASIEEVITLIETHITLKKELFGVEIIEIVNKIGITFFGKKQKIEKNLVLNGVKA